MPTIGNGNCFRRTSSVMNRGVNYDGYSKPEFENIILVIGPKHLFLTRLELA